MLYEEVVIIFSFFLRHFSSLEDLRNEWWWTSRLKCLGHLELKIGYCNLTHTANLRRRTFITSKVSKMIIWSIQYFGVRARRAAWQPKAVLESHKIAPKCPKLAASDLFSHASITERSFGVARNCTKMSQICRQLFISTRKYYRRRFWSRTKSHQNVPNLPLVIYFHAQVLQKQVLE